MYRLRHLTFLKDPNHPRKFHTVGCVGLGLMGHGIAQVTAISHFHRTQQQGEGSHRPDNPEVLPPPSVIAYESNAEFLEKGKNRIIKSLDKLISKNKLSEDDKAGILGRMQFTTELADLESAELVVEAVVENMDVKKDLYAKLGEVCNWETVFASNTSSLSITEMAEATGRPKRFVGVHFFNPVQIMKLVEVIKTEYTDPIVFKAAYDWVKEIGKVPVSCGDTPGFIVNRLLVPSLVQAMLMVDRGDASIHDIDLSMKLGAGHPMGPLHLADYIGLDTCYFILEGWCKQYPHEPAFAIPACLKAKVESGNLGRKTGSGFYSWSGDVRGDPLS